MPREHLRHSQRDSRYPEEYRDGALFLVGGYDVQDHRRRCNRVSVEENHVARLYGAGRFGLAWKVNPTP